MSSVTLDSTRGQNWLISIILLGIVSVVTYFVGRKRTLVLHIGTLAIVFVAMVLTLFKQQSGYTALGFSIILGLVVYIFREDVCCIVDKIKISDAFVKRAYICLGVCLFTFLAVVGTLRYVSYFSEGHDLGIFTQMYEYMLTTGKQLTTIERNELLSHFAIHVSPIYYLLLPIYFIAPSAVTLQICQAVLVSLSLIPLYLLCRHFKLRNKLVLAVGVCYVCFPALTGGCFNDFHENGFLPLLLLCLIYALEKDNNILFIISTILALMVKEDVALQLVVLAVYFIVAGKNKKKAWILMAVSIIYLIVALAILSHGYEGGVLNYMNNMYLTEAGGVIEIIKVVIMNPGYMLRQAFVSAEKIQYIGWIILPIVAALITGKAYSRYILLLYMFFMNLLPSFAPVNDIYAQYHFPVIVFLFYLIIMNVSDWKKEEMTNRIPVILGMTVFLFTVSVFQSGLCVGIEALQHRNDTELINEAVALVPKEASVSSSSLIITHFADHKEVYGLDYEQTDYIVVDYRSRAATEFDVIDAWIKDMNVYEEIYYGQDVVKVYKKNVQ